MPNLRRKSNSAIRQLVDKIIASGQVTRQEHVKLTFTLLAEQRVSDEDRIQINRIFDYLQAGRLKIVD
jgi:hypothetical protein